MTVTAAPMTPPMIAAEILGVLPGEVLALPLADRILVRLLPSLLVPGTEKVPLACNVLLLKVWSEGVAVVLDSLD